MNTAKYRILKRGPNKGRIRALRSFGNVNKGVIGGFVESEDNLSHDGDCWVFRDAYVYGNARVYENAKIYDRAEIAGNARVSGNAQVYGHAEVSDNAWVSTSARVFGRAMVSGNAQIMGGAWVYGSAWVTGDSRIEDLVMVYDHAQVSGNTFITGNAHVTYDPTTVGLPWHPIVITDKHVQLGSDVYTHEHYLEHYKVAWERRHALPENIEEYNQLITILLQLKKKQPGYVDRFLAENKDLMDKLAEGGD